MKIKSNPLKILTALITAAIALFFGSSASKSIAADSKALSESTISERLEKIRQESQPQEKQIASNSEKSEELWAQRWCDSSSC